VHECSNNNPKFVSVQKPQAALLMDQYCDFFRLCLGKWLDQMWI